MENRHSFRRFVNYAKQGIKIFKTVSKERPGLVISYLIFLVIAGMAPYVQSYFLGNVVNALQAGEASRITFAFIVLGIIVFLIQIIYLLQRHLQRLFAYFTQSYYDLLVLEHRGKLDIAQYENKDFGNLMNRVNEKGVWVVNNYLVDMFYAIQSIVAILAIIVIGSSVSWWILIIVVVTSIPELLANIKFSQYSWYIWGNDINTEERRKTYGAKHYFEDTRTFLTEIKLYQTKDWFISKVKGFLNMIYGSQVKNANQTFRTMFFSKLISLAGLFGALILLVTQIVNGNLQIGTFVFLFTAISGFQNEITGLFNNFASQYENSKYLEDLFAFLDTKPLIKNGTKKIDTNQAPLIEFKDVWFKYPSGDHYVYKNFSLTIEPGQKLALIGLNGAGKTTFVKLLCRFYDVEKGQILINKIDIKDIDLSSLYEMIGVVFQEYGKYDLTVGENISLGNISSDSQREKLLDAARSSGALSFIDTYKNKFDQQLGKNFTDSVEPSVGQWQKLALTRLFYRNPSLWILDEPTAAIDAESEMHIFEQLNHLSKNKTVIMISHRFSTVKDADKIIVIKDGEILEEGNHQDLMNSENSEYKKLFLMQKEAYE
jgi:ABC-type multidrug transport system fused ATPase/permease subunit